MLAGEKVGHGEAWKNVAKEIGCTGKVEHDFEWAEEPFVARCPNHGTKTGKRRERGHTEVGVNVIRWKKPLSCEKCGKWLLYFRPESEGGELVEFGGKSELTKYHLEFEKVLAAKRQE